DGQQFVRLLRQDEEVLAVAPPYILEPDVSSVRPDRLGPAANLQLFMRGSEPCVVLRLGSAPGWRIFNLKTGTSSSAGETDASASADSLSHRPKAAVRSEPVQAYPDNAEQ